MPFKPALAPGASGWRGSSRCRGCWCPARPRRVGRVPFGGSHSFGGLNWGFVLGWISGLLLIKGLVRETGTGWDCTGLRGTWPLPRLEATRGLSWPGQTGLCGSCRSPANHSPEWPPKVTCSGRTRPRRPCPRPPPCAPIGRPHPCRRRPPSPQPNPLLVRTPCHSPPVAARWDPPIARTRRRRPCGPGRTNPAQAQAGKAPPCAARETDGAGHSPPPPRPPRTALPHPPLARPPPPRSLGRRRGGARLRRVGAGGAAAAGLGGVGARPAPICGGARDRARFGPLWGCGVQPSMSPPP